MHPSRANIPFLQHKCEKMLGLGVWTDEADGSVLWEWYNKYVTTIHAINRCMRLSPLVDPCIASDPSQSCVTQLRAEAVKTDGRLHGVAWVHGCLSSEVLFRGERGRRQGWHRVWFQQHDR